MITRAALGFVNHLLKGEAWARARLKPLAGQAACLEAGPLALPFVIDGEGLFAVSAGSVAPAVTIRLPDDAPLRWFSDRAAVLGAVRIAGSAELAETLAFVFRNLRWDVEADLSRVVGDIAAHRLAGWGRGFAGWQRQAARNAAANVAEYLTEEAPALARKAEVAAFCTAVDGLLDDCGRLERRLQRLAATR